MTVKCLAKEHNTISPASVRSRAARSGDERNYHETTFNQPDYIGKIIDVKILESRRFEHYMSVIFSTYPVVVKQISLSRKCSQTKISPSDFFFECVLTRSTTSKIIMNRITRTAP